MNSHIIGIMPGVNSNFESDSFIIFSQTHVSGAVTKKYLSEYNVYYFHSRSLQSITYELFVSISKF